MKHAKLNMIEETEVVSLYKSPSNYEHKQSF